MNESMNKSLPKDYGVGAHTKLLSFQNLSQTAYRITRQVKSALFGP